jgi:hypothetical protein
LRVGTARGEAESEGRRVGIAPIWGRGVNPVCETESGVDSTCKSQARPLGALLIWEPLNQWWHQTALLCDFLLEPED